MPVPDLADPRAPYLQIADDLRRQIREGRYKPGDRLPSLPAMCAEYRSASETVRRALRKLRDEGLVATQSTRGTFVLREPTGPEPGADLARMEEAIREAEARLTRHIDSQIAKLREELEYTQAQVMALDARAEGAASRDEGVGR